MPNERVLVGGGTIYDPTLSGNSSNYYKFNWYDFYRFYQRAPWDISESAPPYLYGRYATNIFNYNLFTGILPYQNPYDNNFYYISRRYYGSPSPACNGSYFSKTYLYFDFNFPVVVTKYRMWNGFAANVYRYDTTSQNYSYTNAFSTNIGADYPRDWILYGSNDNFNWTIVDTRTNQTFNYATDRLCSKSPYNEYSITSPTAYKIYRLSVTKGSTNMPIGINCSKSSCACYIYPYFQLGEMQFLGYEDPSVSCSIYGGDTKNITVNYSGDTNIGYALVMFAYNETRNTSGNPTYTLTYNYSDLDFRKYEPLSDFWSNADQGYYELDNSLRGWRSNTRVYISNNNNIAASGVIDLGIAYTLTGYSLRGLVAPDAQYGRYPTDMSATSWDWYGSNDNSSWTLIHSVRNDTGTSASYYKSYSITSPGSYRYYKLNLLNGKQWAYCDKSGCYSYPTVGGLQLIGRVG